MMSASFGVEQRGQPARKGLNPCARQTARPSAHARPTLYADLDLSIIRRAASGSVACRDARLAGRRERVYSFIRTNYKGRQRSSSIPCGSERRAGGKQAAVEETSGGKRISRTTAWGASWAHGPPEKSVMHPFASASSVLVATSVSKWHYCQRHCADRATRALTAQLHQFEGGRAREHTPTAC